MRHILLGGNGYLGRELARMLLAERNEVHIVDLAAQVAPDLAQSPGRMQYTQADIADPMQLKPVPLGDNCVVHHLASRLLIPNRPRFGRDAYFARCNVTGTHNVLHWMADGHASQMVFWSTDMVYGPALVTPRTEAHPRRPFGAYGRSKVAAEDVLMAARNEGCHVTILRPRLIIGPGRLGILKRLFQLIAHNLPVPLIGDGSNRFQFVSAFDCARASVLAADKGCPNTEINLGSANPPRVYNLLSDLIRRAGSNSRLMRTPASAIKSILDILSALKIGPMDPEQYLIADQDVVLDIGRAAALLNWVPVHSDSDMLFAAYENYCQYGARAA
jgi:dTDP-glucose 4,6-dehydratase